MAFNSAVTAQLNLAAAAQRQINQRNAALQMTQKVNFFRNFSQLEQKQNQGENQLIFILDIFQLKFFLNFSQFVYCDVIELELCASVYVLSFSTIIFDRPV